LLRASSFKGLIKRPGRTWPPHSYVLCRA